MQRKVCVPKRKVCVPKRKLHAAARKAYVRSMKPSVYARRQREKLRRKNGRQLRLDARMRKPDVCLPKHHDRAQRQSVSRQRKTTRLPTMLRWLLPLQQQLLPTPLRARRTRQLPMPTLQRLMQMLLPMQPGR